MDPQDLEPRHRPQPPKNLDVMSIGELEDYVAGLQAEIERARAMIASKQDHRSSAEQLFKS
ncbi:MAG: DUF1192 domain-containing protein [Inquilinus sp.]|nr:DUF1192 domain-containing protein [Inquilinus sp.]